MTSTLNFRTETREGHAVKEEVEETFMAVGCGSRDGKFFRNVCAYLNVLVRSVYDFPERGLCAKLLIMNAFQRGTRHAAHTSTFTAPMAQHMRFPSDALRMGWNT